MSWAETTIGDIVDLKHGFAFKGEFFSNQGTHVVLTPGNCFNEGGFKDKGEKEKWYIGDIPEDYLLNEGDLLVVMTDLVNTAPVLGGSFLIPENDKYLHNQRLGLIQIKDASKTCKKFLYYLFNTHGYRGQVRGSASGATVRHTSPNRIKSCKVKIPRDYDDQRRIADVLSNYDYLIENNKRRIELLEESARQLYKEWFVRSRFPGHEHVKIIDGVPEGWEKKPIREILTLNYGKALKAETRIVGNIPVYGSSGVVGLHNKSLVKGPGIVVGRKGNVGSIYWVHSDFFPIDTVYFVSAEESDYFIYYALLHTTFINTDVAVPGLNRDMAYSREILLPTDILRTAFLGEVAPVFEQCEILRKYNEKLSQARDLLLPKLMNGEIAV